MIRPKNPGIKTSGKVYVFKDAEGKRKRANESIIKEIEEFRKWQESLDKLKDKHYK